MMPKRRTPEIDVMLENEAYRRFRGDSIKERTRTKILAARTGLATGYVANILSKMRRQIEADESGRPNINSRPPKC